MAKVRTVNQGAVEDKEPLRPATFKEYGTLNVADFKVFNTWLMEEEKVSFKTIVAKCAELRHRRWAQWHIMAPDNPNIHDDASVFPFVLYCCYVMWIECLFANEFFHFNGLCQCC